MGGVGYIDGPVGLLKFGAGGSLGGVGVGGHGKVAPGMLAAVGSLARGVG